MIVTLLKEQWAEAGITLNIYPVDAAGINSHLNDGSYYTSSLQARVQPISAILITLTGFEVIYGAMRLQVTVGHFSKMYIS